MDFVTFFCDTFFFLVVSQKSFILKLSNIYKDFVPPFFALLPWSIILAGILWCLSDLFKVIKLRLSEILMWLF